MKITGRINLRIPDAEKALWEEQAALCGYKSLSDWIRVRCDVSRGEEELEGVEAPVPASLPPAPAATLPVVQKPVVRNDYKYTGDTGKFGGRTMYAHIQDGIEVWTATPPSSL